MTLYDKHTIIYMKNNGSTWQELDEHFCVTPDTIRNYARSKDWYHKIKQPNPHDGHKDEFERYSEQDGVVTHEIKKRMAEKKTFTRDELLELHSLDPTEFKIKQVVSNEWSMTEAGGEQHYNFQSKIIAEPTKDDDRQHQALLEVLETLEPIHIDYKRTETTDTYLYIPLADMHFMWNDNKDYERLRNDILDLIDDYYSEILISIHGDYFHVDNFNNTTERGTQVDQVDYRAGILEGYAFLQPIIEKALGKCLNVKLVYLPGNHAPSTDLDFVLSIEKLYPNLVVDSSVEDFKHSWLGEHAIFMHHGDKIKNTNRLFETIVGLFPREWGEATSRYLFTGHFHHEVSKVISGMTTYQVMSPSKETSYDKKFGYNVNETGLMAFEFDAEKRKAIHYL